MKLLILVDWYRPAYKAGGPVKSIYHICELLEHNVDISIITGDRDLGDNHAFTEVPLDKWTRKAKANVLYLNKGWKSVLNLIQGIKDVQADTIYVNGLFSWFFNLLPLFIISVLRFKGKLVVAPRGMLHEGALSLKSTKKRVYLKVLKMLLPATTVFHATDEQESEDIQSELGIFKRNIVVLGNLPGTVLDFPTSRKLDNPLRLVLISRLTEKKNIQGLLEELCGVTEEVQLDIYGGFQSRIYEKRCRAISKKLPNSITVKFEGELHPSQVKEVLRGYHFYVLLTQGENFGHSIFEAMSIGLPIIISDTTPWSYVCDNGGGKLWRKTGDLPKILNDLKTINQDQYDAMCVRILKDAKEYANASNYREDYQNIFLN